jgi:hypothetical protein
MKRLAIISILLGMAGCEAGVQTRNAAYPAYEPAPRPGRVQSRWVTLADHFSAQSDKQTIKVNGQDAFRRLRIEAVGGAPVIRQIGVEYSSGATQKLTVEERLAPGQARTFTLNGGEPVHRIIVYADPQYGGAYSVYGAG